MCIRERWSSAARVFRRFSHDHGFLLMSLICAATIASTALWTQRYSAGIPPAPTSPLQESVSAAQLQQQRLQDASTPAPSAQATPVPWQTPLSKLVVLRGFDASRLQAGDKSGVWAVHDAVDLAADVGETVRAMADGTVVAVEEDGIRGKCVQVDHGSGVVAAYAGFSLISDVQPGDRVLSGQTLGFAGNSIADEADLAPHLHLRVTRDGKAVDPLLLLQGCDN